MKELKGTVIPMITPFTDNDTVAVEDVRREVDYLIDAGMDALYPCGTTGEMMYLTAEERKLVAAVTVEQAAGRVPVFVHVGAWSQASTIELAQHAVAIGADGIGVVTPVFFKLSDKALFDFYKAVSDSVPADFPIYLYGIPQCAVNDISPELADKLAKACPNIIGIKYSLGDFTKLQKFTQVNGGRFSVLAGPDHMMAAFMAIGGKGVVSGNAMCVPEHYVALSKAIEEKDSELVKKLQVRTNIFNEILCRNNNIAVYKAVMKDKGIIRSLAMRRPMEALTPEEAEAMMAELKGLDYDKVLI